MGCNMSTPPFEGPSTRAERQLRQSVPSRTRPSTGGHVQNDEFRRSYGADIAKHPLTPARSRVYRPGESNFQWQRDNIFTSGSVRRNTDQETWHRSQGPPSNPPGRPQSRGSGFGPPGRPRSRGSEPHHSSRPRQTNPSPVRPILKKPLPPRAGRGVGHGHGPDSALAHNPLLPSTSRTASRAHSVPPSIHQVVPEAIAHHHFGAILELQNMPPGASHVVMDARQEYYFDTAPGSQNMPPRIKHMVSETRQEYDFGTAPGSQSVPSPFPQITSDAHGYQHIDRSNTATPTHLPGSYPESPAARPPSGLDRNSTLGRGPRVSFSPSSQNEEYEDTLSRRGSIYSTRSWTEDAYNTPTRRQSEYPTGGRSGDNDYGTSNAVSRRSGTRYTN